jgi:hypothetical protein
MARRQARAIAGKNERTKPATAPRATPRLPSAGGTARRARATPGLTVPKETCTRARNMGSPGAI